MKDLEVFVVMCKFNDGWFPYDNYGNPSLVLSDEAASKMYGDALKIFKEEEVKVHKYIATHAKELTVKKSWKFEE